MPTLSRQVDLGLNLLLCAFSSETNKLFSTHNVLKLMKCHHLFTELMSIRQVNMTQQDSGMATKI